MLKSLMAVIVTAVALLLLSRSTLRRSRPRPRTSVRRWRKPATPSRRRCFADAYRDLATSYDKAVVAFKQ